MIKQFCPRRKNTKGKFIVFEGIDGSGKTSQIYLLREKLSQIGIESIITGEPSKGPVGNLLRSIQQGKNIINPSQKVMTFLYAADRAHHIDWINEKLNEGVWVLCDRYKYSSLAYQNVENEEQLVLTEEINRIFPDPDYVFFIDVNPKLSLRRIESRGIKEIFEREDLLEKVRNNYIDIFSKDDSRDFMSMIDGTFSREEIGSNIFKILQRKFNL